MTDNESIDRELEVFTAPLTEGESTPEHDAWIRAKVEKTLAKKTAGTMTYYSLDEVMREFGFNAR